MTSDRQQAAHAEAAVPSFDVSASYVIWPSARPTKTDPPPTQSTFRETKHTRYNVSEKGRERYWRYRATTKGLLNEERQYQKRMRGWYHKEIAEALAALTTG